MRTFCWIICVVASCVAAIFLFFAITADAAPQQAAGAAIACAIVVIPYVFTRAIEATNNPKEDQNEEIIILLKQIRDFQQPK